MALLNLSKSIVNVLRIKHNSLCERNFSVTSLFLLNQRFSRLGSYKEKEKRLMGKDKVPQTYELIYKAPMESYIAWATHVSTATASIIGAAAIYQFALSKPILEPIDLTLIMESEDIYYFAAGFLAINSVVRLVVSMFTLRIYKKEKDYLAVYNSQLPFLTTQHNFKRGQVKAVSYLLSPWNNITYKLGDKTSLLLDDYFRTPSEFHEMRDDIKTKF